MLGFIKDYNFLDMKPQYYWELNKKDNLEQKKRLINNIIYSEEYIASEKKDGYWEMILKDEDGNIFMRAREKGVNGWILKQDWVPHLKDFFNLLPNGTCLLTEVFLPNKTSKDITKILGCGVEKAIQRQKEDEKLHLYIYDILSWGMNIIINYPIIKRISFLEKIKINNTYVEKAIYWSNSNDIHENWLKIISNNGEGVVLTKKDYFYEPGARRAKKTLKLKKHLQENIDVFLTGRWKLPTKIYTGKCLESWKYWEDEITGERYEGSISEKQKIDSLVPVTKLYFYNMAGAIEIATIYKNKVTPIGWISGIPDEIRLDIVKNPDKYKGKVIEIQAMETGISNNIPTLRHGKIVNWRNQEDKQWSNCIWQ